MSEGMGGHAADRLRSFVQRIERLEEEKSNIASDIKDVYAEAKSSGFDTRTILAEVALYEAVVLADRCADRPCPEKNMGGTCADCPTERPVFGEFLPEEVGDA